MYVPEFVGSTFAVDFVLSRRAMLHLIASQDIIQAPALIAQEKSVLALVLAADLVLSFGTVVATIALSRVVDAASIRALEF
jgi:hypothetical protein